MSKPTVVVIGASADRSKFSNKAVRAYRDQGWDVYPINPKGEPIEGIASYASVDQVPVPIQRATLYLPPGLGIKVLPALAALSPAEFFVNPGADSLELLAEAERLGLHPIQACSIVEIGASPSQY